MSITLYHHPMTRAASVVAMLEEVGCEYELVFVDVRAGAHKEPEIVALNPMGKLPILVDDGVVVTETAAIGLYLADRHAPGRLAPAIDDAARGTYLRWSLFAPSVIEPCAYAKGAGWEYRPSSAGWGTWQAMHAAIDGAIGEGPWLLGDRFSMADLVFGSTLRFLLGFGMLETRDRFTSYVDRLSARPAVKRGDARNAQVIAARGLTQ